MRWGSYGRALSGIRGEFRDQKAGFAAREARPAKNGDVRRMAFQAIARAASATRRSHAAVVCALVGAVLAGCASSNNEAAKALNPDPPAKMYAFAEGLLNNQSYTDAAK